MCLNVPNSKNAKILEFHKILSNLIDNGMLLWQDDVDMLHVLYDMISRFVKDISYLNHLKGDYTNQELSALFRNNTSSYLHHQLNEGLHLYSNRTE